MTVSATIDSVALKPCPFCGYPPIFENTVTEAVVRCRTCSVVMKAKHKPKSDAPGIQEVEARWNNRSPLIERRADVS